MIYVTQQYKEACESSERKSYVIAKYGLYNKKAKLLIDSSSGLYQNFSSLEKTYNEVKTTNYNYISCEPNRVKLNGSFYFVSNKETKNAQENLAYWSLKMSDADKKFTSNPKIIYTFKEDIEFTELTLNFQELCTHFIVRYFKNNETVAFREVNNNDILNPTTRGASTLSDIKFDKVELEFIETAEPYRYIKFNEIDFGVYQQFTEKEIIDFDIIDELSIDSSELSSNSLNIIVDDTKGEYNILNPNNKIKDLQEKQEITFYHYLKVGNRYQEMPLGTFLLKTINVENNILEVQAYDDIYFMNDIYYGSNFYENEEVSVILKDLFDYFDNPHYQLDNELEGIKLTGYVPNVKCREALRLIAEAAGCVINKTRYGETYIFKTYDPVTKKFGRNLIFEEKPQKNMFNKSINVVEYNYTTRQENVELCNLLLKKGKHIVVYNLFPILQNSLQKMEENENYKIIKAYATTCEIEVYQETTVKLKGTLVKETSIVKKMPEVKDFEGEDFTIKKVDNKLITSDNTEEIAVWKLSRGETRYNFKTKVMPYIEVGDTCEYQTKFNTKSVFIPTRIQFTKSILQQIEGE